MFNAYDHIYYNGEEYYSCKYHNDIMLEKGTGAERSRYYVKVYLVDNKGKVHYEHPYYATVYYEDDCLCDSSEHTYLYFGSGIYTNNKEKAYGLTPD